MGVRVELHDGEAVQLALRRFGRLAFLHQRRPWYKRALGFHETPSRVRHKRAYVERLKHGPAGSFYAKYLHMGLERQLLPGDPCRGAWGMGYARHWAYIGQALRQGGREAVAGLQATRSGKARPRRCRNERE